MDFRVERSDQAQRDMVSRHRGRIISVLYLTHRLPYAPNRGDRIRAHHTLQVLQDRASIELVSLVHDEEEASHAGELRGLVERVHLAPVGRLRNWLAGASSLATGRPLTHALLDSPVVRPTLHRIVAERRPDVVLAYCSGMARFALEPPLAGLPLVIDLVDVDSLKWRALADNSVPPMKWILRREAKWLSRFEARAARSAFATVLVNERERGALTTIAPGARAEVVPNGIDGSYWRPPFDPTISNDIVFCGVMNYRPNEEAAIWLARQVWPLVRRRCVTAKLRLVGSDPTARVKRLAVDPSIEVTGHVPDVRPYLWCAALAAAPLQAARGIQNKVLEAVAAGLPAVITPVVADGLPPEILAACVVADGATEFAAAVVRCLALSPPARRAVAGKVNLDALSWSTRLSRLFDLLHEAADERGGDADQSLGARYIPSRQFSG